MNRIVLASGNTGKLREIRALLADRQVELIPQTEFDIPEAIEDGLSFVENAIIKARHAATLTGLPALADDSGLCVDALLGAPGIHSARYAGISGPRESVDAANNLKLLSDMQDIPEEKRTARFQCVIALVRHAADPMPLICQGSWEGRILFAAEGAYGFGYDPLFFVPTHGCASARLAPEVKNSLSHRGQALRELQCRWPA